MMTWILLAALALGGKPAHHKTPVKVRKDDTDTKVVWVCKGNSYMMLKKGFKPDKSKKCRPTKIKGESDKP